MSDVRSGLFLKYIQAMCISPIFIKRENKPTRGDTVPCGKCHICKKKNLNQWLFRLSKQLEISQNAFFFTLTYNEENVKPLSSADISNFMKRLRKVETGNGKSKLKYFIVGEHGTKHDRPHYHGIMFNIDKPLNITNAWKNNGKLMGYTNIQPLKSLAGIRYTLKYIHKNTTKERFIRCSKGLGLNYLTPQIISYHTNSVENCKTRYNGRWTSLPKYFKEKIYTEEQRAEVTRYLHKIAEEVKQQRINELGSEHLYEMEITKDHTFTEKQDKSNSIANYEQLVAQLQNSLK